MGNRREQRTRLAVPVKVHTRDAENRPLTQVACTLDISPRGVRLNGVRYVQQTGEILSLERGKYKAFYRVTWVGTRTFGTEGQVGLECIEPGTSIWGIDLLPGEDERYESVKSGSRTDDEKARQRRYSCSGTVRIFKDKESSDAQHGELSDISAAGCYIRMGMPLPSQTRTQLHLKIPDYKLEIGVRGQVGMSDRAMGMWVAFTEISRDHQAALENLLKELRAKT